MGNLAAGKLPAAPMPDSERGSADQIHDICISVVAHARQFARVHYAADDRLLIAAPMFHCWGLINGVLGISAVGGTAIIIRRFRIEPVLDLIEGQLLGQVADDRPARSVEPAHRPQRRGPDAPGADRGAPARLGCRLRRVVWPDRDQPGDHDDHRRATASKWGFFIR